MLVLLRVRGWMGVRMGLSYRPAVCLVLVRCTLLVVVIFLTDLCTGEVVSGPFSLVISPAGRACLHFRCV